MDAITCVACGKRYTWRDEFRGRVLTCQCGEAMSALDPTDAGKGARAAASSAAPRGGSVPRGFAASHRARPQSQETGAGTRRTWVAPAVLLAVGIIGRIIVIGWLRTGESGAAMAAPMSAVGIVIGIVAIGVGLALTARVTGSALESPQAIALKAAGLAAFGGTLAMLCVGVDKDAQILHGVILGLLLMLVVYFIGFCWLSKMDLQEALMAAVIAVAVQAGLYVAIVRSLPKGTARLIILGP